VKSHLEYILHKKITNFKADGSNTHIQNMSWNEEINVSFLTITCEQPINKEEKILLNSKSTNYIQSLL
jgi:hypothetical protein